MPLSLDKVNHNQKGVAQKWNPQDLDHDLASADNPKENNSISPAGKFEEKITGLFELIQDKNSQVNSSRASEIHYPKLNGDCVKWQPNELEKLQDGFGDVDGHYRLRASQSKVEEILNQAKIKQAEIIHQAEQEAQQIREQAEQAANEIRKQAYSDGVASANAETQTMLMTANSILEEVQAWKNSLYDQGEMMMLRLVIEIAQTIFGDGLPLDPDTLGQAFARALSQAKTLGNLRIFVHPEDAAALTAHWNQLQGTMGGHQIELIPSEVIKRGGCYIDGEFGSVDARVETQFQNIKDALLTPFEKSMVGVAG